MGTEARTSRRRPQQLMMIVAGLMASALAAQVTTVGRALAAGAPKITGVGYGAYDPLATSAPEDQFDVLTLIAGGADNVNTSSLTIVTPPPGADGKVTPNPSSSHDLVDLSPAAGASGRFSLTFGICSTGYNWPNTAECSAGTLVYLPATDTLMGDPVSITAGLSTQVENAYMGVGVGATVLAGGAEATTVAQGSQVTIVSAPVSASLPASISADGITAIVKSASAFTAVMPVPQGLTLDSAALIGGDAYTAGASKLTQCTAASHPSPCSANESGHNYADNTYPYIELSVPSAVQVPGGHDFTLPTVEATFTATGTVGEVVKESLTEVLVSTSFSVLGTSGVLTFDGFPASTAACSSGWPSSTADCSGTPTLTKAPLASIATVRIVARATATVVLSLSSPSVSYGHEETVTFAVTVTAHVSGHPQGSVRVVTGGGANLCAMTLSNGTGRCSVPSTAATLLAPGNYGTVASYSGSPDLNPSTSASKTMTVQRATSRTTLALSAKSVAYGSEQTLKLTVAVSPQYGGVPAGTVTILAGTRKVCSTNIVASAKGRGGCSPSASTLASGSYALTASFGGNVDFATSVSEPVALEVTKTA
jgi:hypothetical protein